MNRRKRDIWKGIEAVAGLIALLIAAALLRQGLSADFVDGSFGLGFAFLGGTAVFDALVKPLFKWL